MESRRIRVAACAHQHLRAFAYRVGNVEFVQHGAQRGVCARSNLFERYGIERHQVTRLCVERDAFAHLVAPTLRDGKAHAELCRATRCQHGVAVVGYQRVRGKALAQ